MHLISSECWFREFWEGSPGPSQVLDEAAGTTNGITPSSQQDPQVTCGFLRILGCLSKMDSYPYRRSCAGHTRHKVFKTSPGAVPQVTISNEHNRDNCPFRLPSNALGYSMLYLHESPSSTRLDQFVEMFTFA